MSFEKFPNTQTSYSLHSASQCHSRGALAMTRCRATHQSHLGTLPPWIVLPLPFPQPVLHVSCHKAFPQGVPDSTSKSYPSLSMHTYLLPKQKRDQVSWGTSLLLSYPATRNSVTELCIMQFSLSTRHNLGLPGKRVSVRSVRLHCG